MAATASQLQKANAMYDVWWEFTWSGDPFYKQLTSAKIAEQQLYSEIGQANKALSEQANAALSAAFAVSELEINLKT
jgi:hypothetical protein